MEAWLQLSHAVNVHPVPQVLKLVLITEFCRVSANQGIFGLEIYSLNFGAPAMNVGSMGSDHEMRRVGRATRRYRPLHRSLEYAPCYASAVPNALSGAEIRLNAISEVPKSSLRV